MAGPEVAVDELAVVDELVAIELTVVWILPELALGIVDVTTDVLRCVVLATELVLVVTVVEGVSVTLLVGVEVVEVVA